MREVPSYISERLKKNIQTKANDSAPSARLWVSRQSTVLVNDEFLERQTVANSSVTDASIAVCHPRIRRSNTDIYVAYISNGVARVVTSKHRTAMNQHDWTDTGFEVDATAVSIAFDGTMPKSYGSEIEFVTEQTPWVFWVNDRKLFAQKLGGETVTLAEANCTDVSAVRAAWSQFSAFEFGLVVFFIIGGSLYYRQLIRGEWTDGERVSFGPSGVTWSGVSAFRTWDFRVGVQLKSTNGDIYELFTQFMGIGTRNAEHLEVKGASHSGGSITAIQRMNTKADEHITIADVSNVAPYQGIYELGVPSLLDVYNTHDVDGDWGKTVVFVFDKELNNDTVQDSISSFYFIDSIGMRYYPLSIKMDHTGRRAILTCIDFNNAVGKCTAYYSPGLVTTMLDEVLPAQSYEFTPINLVPYEVILPEVAEILNMNDIGTEVAIRFTEPLTSAPPESAEHFIVTISEAAYVPGGPLSKSSKPVISVELSADDPHILILYFQDGMYTSIRNAVGEVTVQYNGNTLTGLNGLVPKFVENFSPEGLYMKPHPNDAEHIDISNVTLQATLTEINYSNACVGGEHLQITAATMDGGVLTHINDL